MELWKDVPGYEGLYQVSNFGRIRNCKRRMYLFKLKPNKRGYIYVDLTKDKMSKKYRVHRLVAKAFIPNPNNLPQINHIDGNKRNNKVDNLEWCTAKHNIQEAYKIGLMKISEKQKRALSEYCKKMKIKKVAQYDKNMKLIKIWKSQKEASKQTNISKTSINNNVRGLSKTAGGYIWVTI